jgi:hypothetical protein
MTDDIRFATTESILCRLYASFIDVSNGCAVDPKLLDDAANEIEWLRSIVAATLNGPFRGTSEERRDRMYGSDWAEVQDALDRWEKSRG